MQAHYHIILTDIYCNLSRYYSCIKKKFSQYHSRLFISWYTCSNHYKY